MPHYTSLAIYLRVIESGIKAIKNGLQCRASQLVASWLAGGTRHHNNNNNDNNCNTEKSICISYNRLKKRCKTASTSQFDDITILAGNVACAGNHGVYLVFRERL